MRYLATAKIFENMLQLNCFGLCFEGILNKNWLLSYRNNDISYRGSRYHYFYMRVAILTI